MPPKTLLKKLPKELLENNVLMARQSILDVNHGVYGFEVLYRGKRFDVTKASDGMGATGELLNNIYTSVVEENLTSSQPLFINVDQGFIESPSFFPSHTDTVILEILETVPATPTILEKIKKLRRMGFEFALDDYEFEPERVAFLPLMSIVKIDVLLCPMEKIIHGLPTLKQYSATLLAEKIEDFEVLKQCQALGFTLFQGYYLERPKLVHGMVVSASSQVTLKLLSELTRQDISVKEVSDLISCDPRLALKIVLLVNSSMFSFVRQIYDVQEAVVKLGIEAVKRWSIILLLVAESKSPVEIFRVILARAKALELFAVNQGPEKQTDYFTLGLFSGIDAILGMEMKKVTKSIPLSDEIVEALNDNTGSMGEMLQLVKKIETFDTDMNGHSVDTISALESTYWQGLIWADELMDSVVKH